MGNTPHTRYYLDGTIKDESWYKSPSKFHRDDGPAIINYKPDGTIKSRYWYRDGKPLFRDFTSIEMVNQYKTWDLFTPVELARMRSEW